VNTTRTDAFNQPAPVNRMHQSTSTLLCLILTTASCLGQSDSADLGPFGATSQRTITITLQQHLDYIIPPPPVQLVPGSTLRLELGEPFSAATDIEWFQGDQIVAVGEQVYSVGEIPNEFHHHFAARLKLDGQTQWTHGVEIITGHFRQNSLLNLSSRFRLTEESPPLVSGFVIARERSFFDHQMVLFRAVGPELAKFGIGDPLPNPQLRIFNSRGVEITPQQVFEDRVYSDGSTPESRYHDFIDLVAQHVGAFPLNDPRRGDAPSSSVSKIAYLPAGSYTAAVTSASGQSGEVLLEIYLVFDPPEQAQPPD